MARTFFFSLFFFRLSKKVPFVYYAEGKKSLSPSASMFGVYHFSSPFIFFWWVLLWRHDMLTKLDLPLDRANGTDDGADSGQSKGLVANDWPIWIGGRWTKIVMKVLIKLWWTLGLCYYSYKLLLLKIYEILLRRRRWQRIGWGSDGNETDMSKVVFEIKRGNWVDLGMNSRTWTLKKYDNVNTTNDFSLPCFC